MKCEICLNEEKEFISGIVGENGLITFTINTDDMMPIKENANICLICFNTKFKKSIEKLKENGTIKSKYTTCNICGKKYMLGTMCGCTYGLKI